MNIDIIEVSFLNIVLTDGQLYFLFPYSIMVWVPLPYMARYNIFLTDSDIYYLEEQEVKTNEVALPVSWARGLVGQRCKPCLRFLPFHIFCTHCYSIKVLVLQLYSLFIVRMDNDGKQYNLEIYYISLLFFCLLVPLCSIKIYTTCYRFTAHLELDFFSHSICICTTQYNEPLLLFYMAV